MISRKMYAIFRKGSKQYKVQPQDIVDIDLLGAKEGEEVTFDEVLLLSNEGDVKVGAPTVNGSLVKGTVVTEVLGPKVIAYKYRRRKSSHRKVGHRQRYTRVQITEIAGG